MLNLIESLQNALAEQQKKYNELKRKFYKLAYGGYTAEHYDAIKRQRDALIDVCDTQSVVMRNAPPGFLDRSTWPDEHVICITRDSNHGLRMFVSKAVDGHHFPINYDEIASLLKDARRAFWS